MNKLAELLRQGSDRLIELPNDARRFMTNPQAFTQLVTGINPMPRETGFAAGAMGIPANNENIEYQQGFQQGELYELPIALASMGAPLVAPAAKALAPKAAQMAENYMVKQGFMPSVVPPTSSKEIIPQAYKEAFEIEKRTGTKIKPEEVSKIQQIYDMMAKERQLKTMKPSDFPRWGDITKTADDDLAMIADLQKKVDQQKVLDMMQAEKVSRREILEKQLKNIKK